MSEQAGFGIPDWIPQRSQVMMRAEDAATRRAERKAEAARAERQEQAHERALGAYRTAQELRGETVSALALATGQVAGRSIEDVFADARRAADREDARDVLRQQREATGEPVHVLVDDTAVQRAAERLVDRQLRRAEDLHQDLIRYQVRHDYPAAMEAARAKQAGR